MTTISIAVQLCKILLSKAIVPHTTNKILPVVIIFYYLFALNSPDNDMMQGSRRLPAIASSGEAGGHPV